MPFVLQNSGTMFATSNASAPNGIVYKSTDTIATVKTTAYFNTEKYLKIGSLIYVVASDAKAFLIVTAISPDVTVTEFAASSAGIFVAQGIHTTLGGASAEDITIPGVVATDTVVVTLHTAGSTPRTIASAKSATGKITVTFSGDPSTDHKVNYVVTRAG
jgi:hypothetical protein